MEAEGIALQSSDKTSEDLFSGDMDAERAEERKIERTCDWNTEMGKKTI